MPPTRPTSARPRASAALILLLAVTAAGALLVRSARTDAPVTLRTLELGRGVTFVFVHDLGMSRNQWLPMARRMIGGQRVVLVDLPGHGESPMPEDFGLEKAAAALDQVLAREQPDSTVVVGHGLGGLVALIEARAHPERMRGVALVSAAIRVGAGIPDQQRQMFMQMLDQRYDDFLKLQYGKLGRDSAQGIAMHAQAVRVPKVAMMAYLRELLTIDSAALTKGVTVPVLMITTDRDTTAARDSLAFVKQAGLETAARLRVLRIAGSGHYVMADQPDSLRLRLTEFAARVVGKQ